MKFYTWILCFIVMEFIFCSVNAYRSRIIGGSATTINQYPIIAQLLVDPSGSQNYAQYCAGVIITSRHVLSTAHCFQYSPLTGIDYSQPRFWKVRVGTSYRTYGGALHSIKKIIPHPGFDKHYYLNDVAVVVVKNRFKFTQNVKQATLIRAGKEIVPNSLCTVVGWGALEVQKLQPEQLHHGHLLTVDHYECGRRYSTIKAVIMDSMLCAGRLDQGGVDGCYGDSGGPLIYKGVVIGLVSFGYACGHPFYPGVYTNVSHFTDWIVHTASNNK